MTGPELQLSTTIGRYALQDCIGKRNAPIVEKVSLSVCLHVLRETASSALAVTGARQSRRYNSWKSKFLGRSTEKIPLPRPNKV